MSLLDRRAISERLDTESFGRTMYVFSEVGSTNEAANELASNGAPHGTVVIADSQTRGRGRMGRKWLSPPGCNLYISVILRPALPARDAPFITFVASIALHEAATGAGVKASIKWPNDLLAGVKKAAGVLTEMEVEGEKAKYMVVGIGVNLNMTDKMLAAELGEVASEATSFLVASGREVDREAFAASLINQLEKRYTEFMSAGKGPIIQQWTKRCGLIGRQVEVCEGDSVTRGVAEGINGAGHLLLRKTGGEVEEIGTGDVAIV